MKQDELSPIENWKYDVANGDTILGYVDWVNHNLESMKTAKYVCDITVIDPDSKGKVEMIVYKHPNGGLFAIDFSFIDQVLGADTNEDNYKMIPDPLVNTFGRWDIDSIVLGE